MGLFDWVGDKPNQISLSELLGALPAVAGPVLAYRGGRIGMPLGFGLSAMGGLAETLGQRQHQYALAQAQQAQNINGIRALAKVDPVAAKYASIVDQGGTPQEFWQAYQSHVKGGEKAIPIFNQKLNQERFFTPTADNTQPPQGWVSKEFYQKPVEDKITNIQRSLIEGYLQTHPGATQLEAAMYAEDQMNRNRAKYAKPPSFTVNNYQALDPNKLIPIGTNPDGTPKYGVLEANKTGGIKASEAPAGVRPPPPKATAKKAWTATDAANLVTKIEGQVKTELTKKSLLGYQSPPSGEQVREATTKRLMSLGYDADGMPLKVGTKVSIP